MIDPLAAFALGYALLALASARGAKAYLSILILITVYLALAATPREALEAARRLLEWNDLRVFVYLFLSLFLAGLMREKGLLQMLVDSTGMAGCRFSMLSVPALIGLIPMPGGALVSAIALRRRFLEEARLPPEDASYINYWFRHLWVPSWPLFQSVLITASVLGVSPLAVVAHTWPATPAAILGGLAVAWPLLRGVRCPRPPGGGALRLFLRGSWPLLLLAGLFVASRTSLAGPLGRLIPLYSREPMLASLAVAVLLVLATGVSARMLAGALRLATRPTIHLVLLESLYFKNLIGATGASASVERLAEQGVPVLLLVVLVPFVLGMAAGGENFFASTAMPLLAPYLAGPGGMDWFLLAAAYAGGYLGVMASPVHLCLVLTVEYYGARMGRVLRLVAASVAISLALALALEKILLG